MFQTSAINFIAMASFEIKLFDTGFELVWKLTLACLMIPFHRFGLNRGQRMLLKPKFCLINLKKSGNTARLESFVGKC